MSDSQRKLLEFALRGGDSLLGLLLGLQPKLHQPLVALGAPVALYYPAVAQLLQCELHIPPYAAIANALGAVAGGVIKRVTATITPVGDEAFRVHIASGVRTFRALDQALEYAHAEAQRLAEQQAQRSGAIGIELDCEQHDNRYTTPDGRSIFFEARIIARAHGRPKLKLSD